MAETKKNSKIYNAIIDVIDKFVPAGLRPLWMHPAGPKTIFFWGPIFKWGIVLAGLGDVIQRPPELIPIPQTSILILTSTIWSRYSVVIIPKNWSLFACNIGIASMHSIQLLRAIKAQKFDS